MVNARPKAITAPGQIRRTVDLETGADTSLVVLIWLMVSRQ
jgi:hypothetical protein